jgi:hypothetical protein
MPHSGKVVAPFGSARFSHLRKMAWADMKRPALRNERAVLKAQDIAPNMPGHNLAFMAIARTRWMQQFAQ